jgi:sulfur carrier protein
MNSVRTLAMEIELNGAPHPIAAGQNVHDLIDALDLANKSVAVAINREVVPRHMWRARVLQPADKVDIVRAIGGG